jgi:hypothetical protein
MDAFPNNSADQGKDRQLDEGEAMKMASLMQATLQERGVDRQIKAADYTSALQIVEHMQSAAAQESDAKKLAFETGRILNHAAITAALPVMVVDTLMSGFTRSMFLTDGRSSGVQDKTQWGPLTDSAIDIYRGNKQSLEDAAYALRQLENAAKKIERQTAAEIGEGVAQ